MTMTQPTHQPRVKPYATATNVVVIADDLAPWAETRFTASAAIRPLRPAQRPRSERSISGPLSRSVLLTAGLVMPLHPSDDVLASADTFTSALPQTSPKPIEAARENVADAEERPWRGVFAIAHGDEVLFTKRIDITASKLDDWVPDPIVGRRRPDDDE